MREGRGGDQDINSSGVEDLHALTFVLQQLASSKSLTVIVRYTMYRINDHRLTAACVNGSQNGCPTELCRCYVGRLARNILFAVSLLVYKTAHVACWGSHLQVHFEKAQSLLIISHGRLETLCLHRDVPQQHQHICTPNIPVLFVKPQVSQVLIPLTTLMATCFYNPQTGIV